MSTTAQQAATTPAPAPKPRTPRRDAYLATVRISIALDTTNPDSYSAAVKAVEGIKAGLPEGATVSVEARLGKV